VHRLRDDENDLDDVGGEVPTSRVTFIISKNLLSSRPCEPEVAVGRRIRAGIRNEIITRTRVIIII